MAAADENSEQVRTICYGAAHNLEARVNRHLFIISPNNSGSTFLKNILATSRHTWNLVREGQHVAGFAGPCTGRKPGALIWASEPELLAIYDNPAAYDWPVSRKAWYFQAYSRNPNASIFVTKAPPFLLHVASLQTHFNNATFLFMVRDPYAVVEGIFRRKRGKSSTSAKVILEAASAHIVNCFQIQIANLETFRELGVFFTYEMMCDEPDRVEAMIKPLIPELDDLNLRQSVPVKGLYNEMLRNMNEEQIGRLSAAELAVINRVFAHHRDLLAHFGYPLRP